MRQRLGRTLALLAVLLGATVVLTLLDAPAPSGAAPGAMERALLSLVGVVHALLFGAVSGGSPPWRTALVLAYLASAVGAGWEAAAVVAPTDASGFRAASSEVGAWIAAASRPLFAVAALRSLTTSVLPRSWARFSMAALTVGLLSLLAAFGPVPADPVRRVLEALVGGAALLTAIAAARPSEGAADGEGDPAVEGCFAMLSAALALHLLPLAALAMLPDGRQEAVQAGLAIDATGMAAHCLLVLAPLYGVMSRLGQVERTVEDLHSSLRRSDHRYARLLEATRDLTFELDADGVVTSANGRWRDVMGVEPDATIGSRLTRWVHPDDQRAVEAALETCRRGHEPGAECEFRAGPSPAGWRTLRAQLDPVRDEARPTLSVLGVCKDITDRRALELELANAQRLERVGALSAGIAHDFNNVLASIVHSTATLRAERGLSYDVRTAVATIIEAAERGADLARSLMALGRSPRPGGPTWTPLGASIDRVLRVLVPNLGDLVRLRIDIPEDAPDVVGQPAELEQVLMNLLLNARDALPEGGEILLSAREEGVMGVIEVSDNGTGIPEDVLPRVFEPYVSTKGAGRGTGLGLAIVRRLVEDLGGTVAVRSRPADGTTFTVRLPCRTGARATAPLLTAPSPEFAPTLDPDPPSGEDEVPAVPARVLVIDDDALVRRAAARALGSAALEVETASTLEEALEHLGERTFDVAILDVALSATSDPADNLAALQARAPELPVVVSSGNHSVADIQHLLDAGAVAFLPKPTPLDEVVRVVRAVMVPGGRSDEGPGGAPAG